MRKQHTSMSFLNKFILPCEDSRKEKIQYASAILNNFQSFCNKYCLLTNT